VKKSSAGHCSVVTAPDGETLVCVYHAWNAERTSGSCVSTDQMDRKRPTVTPDRSGWKSCRQSRVNSTKSISKNLFLRLFKCDSLKLRRVS
jgi:hypothetical protein